jgi:23S rRNA (cytosine1962-C5)-methyltransferase
MSHTPSTESDVTSSSAEFAPGFGRAQVILKPKKSRPFYGRHPWVLESAVDRVEGEPADGDVVDLLNEKKKFIARGIFNSHSRIRVRLYSWDAGEGLTRDWLEKRLIAAIELRRQLGILEPSDGARIVFSESDQLSGLIVDRYADYLSLQVNSLAMAQRLGEIVPILVEHLRPRGVVIKQERGIGPLEGIKLDEGLHWGELPDGPIFITENKLKFGVDLREGQKTGYYLDQRDNRAAVARYAFGKRVLDICCYAGGFSLNAAQNATEVLGIDSSARAVTLATENARLNNITNAKFEVGDAFGTLDRLTTEGQRFGMIILDPPKFAHKRDKVDDALMAYHRLNRAAVDLLEPGGILVTCSCSGHVQREDFLDMLAGVAQRTGRDIQILEQRGAAPDHPVSATCLETEYLKCFICRAG